MLDTKLSGTYLVDNALIYCYNTSEKGMDRKYDIVQFDRIHTLGMVFKIVNLEEESEHWVSLGYRKVHYSKVITDTNYRRFFLHRWGKIFEEIAIIRKCSKCYPIT